MIGVKVENGIVVNSAVFPEKGPLFHGWVVARGPIGKGFVDNGDGTFSPPPAKAPVVDPLALFKSQLAVSVRSIVVTVNGRKYNGDEEAQSRMARAVIAAEFRGSSVIPAWKLADDTVAQDVPVDDFKEAVALSLEAQSDVWFS